MQEVGRKAKMDLKMQEVGRKAKMDLKMQEVGREAKMDLKMQETERKNPGFIFGRRRGLFWAQTIFLLNVVF